MRRIVPQIEGTNISNFEICLHRRVNICAADPSSESIPCVEVTLAFEGGDLSETKRVPLSNLESINWHQLDFRASINPQVTIAKANRYIANNVRSMVSDLSEITVFQLDHPGLYIIEGEPIFCTGGEIIRPSSGSVQKVEIECGPMQERLDVDPNLSEQQAASEVLNLISLFPDAGRIILPQVLVAFLAQAYEDAGKRPAFCVFLYGKSGTQKTTVASFLTQVYNRSEGIAELTRLSASRASTIEMLMDVKDQVKVFDDLFPAGSTQVRKKQEETLSEITRFIGDGTVPAQMKGNELRVGRPRCGVLFTGEYVIGEGSDAARLLPVKMSKPDTTALKYFQNRPLVVSTFYHNFLSWFIEDYKRVVVLLKDWLDEYRKTDMGLHDRLRETHYFLNSAYTLLLQYCGEKGVLGEDEILRFHADFLELLNRLVREQNQQVHPETMVSSQHGNPLDRISELYKTRQLSIATDKKKFCDGQDDGIIHRDCLCLRPQALERFFPSSDPNNIARELAAHDALVQGREGFMKKISAISGKYCLCIPMNRLQ